MTKCAAVEHRHEECKEDGNSGGDAVAMSDGEEPGAEAKGAEGQQEDPLFGADEEPEGDAIACRGERSRVVRGSAWRSRTSRWKKP